MAVCYLTLRALMLRNEKTDGLPTQLRLRDPPRCTVTGTGTGTPGGT
jgi:hypothetical protein